MILKHPIARACRQLLPALTLKRLTAGAWRQLLPALLLLLLVPCGLRAAGEPEDLLPPVSCAPGWPVEGKTSVYDRETLSDRIDCEAELYFPYGFERMAAARYGSPKNPGAGIDVEIFRMGSLLDAFGMYANYRQKDARNLPIGAGSSLAPSQLFFYQGRHFIQIQITGTEDADPDALAACGRAVAARLPGPARSPAELSAFDRPELVKGSERYLPESLLGYDFLNKGLMADAVLEGTTLQVFILLGGTPDSAALALQRFRSQLAQGELTTIGKDHLFLEGVDPLYGPVVVLKKGACFAGALKFSGKKAPREFLESFCR